MRVFARISMLMAAAGLLVAAGCGGNNNNNPDARPRADAAGQIDADTTPDAMPPTPYAGQISIVDISVANDAQLGHGGQIIADFTEVVDDSVATGNGTKIFDNRSAIGEGCAAWEYDLGSGQAPQPSTDEGPIDITVTNADSNITPVNIPTCAFVNGDYACIGPAGAAVTNDAIDANAGSNNMGLNTITIAAAPFSTDDIGRYVMIAGAPAFFNNGVFPVINEGNSGATLTYFNPAASDNTDIAGITYTVIAGAGPTPSGVEFLNDTDKVEVKLTAPSGADVASFDSTLDVGQAFTMKTDLTAIPLTDTAALDVDCDSAVTTGTGDITAGTGTNEFILTNDTALGSVRVGAEVKISGASTAANNGTFTITQATGSEVHYINATSGAAAETGVTYTVDDCGNTAGTATVLYMNFNDNPNLTKVYVNETGSGAFANQGSNVCRITDAGKFSKGMTGLALTVTGATTAGNNNDTTTPVFQVTNSDTDFIEYLNPNCADENADTATNYQLWRPLEVYESPDPTPTGKAGVIFCAAITGHKITVPTGALKAITDVNPKRVRSSYIRGGFGYSDDNKTSIIVGHGVAGFTDAN